MNAVQLIEKLIETTEHDDYLAVGFKVRRKPRKGRGGDRTIMCSFTEPDNETVPWLTAVRYGAYREPQDIFAQFEAWIDDVLRPAVTPTRGDGCLYQAGWFVLIADDNHVYTVEVHYWERTADEEEEYHQRRLEMVKSL